MLSQLHRISELVVSNLTRHRIIRGIAIGGSLGRGTATEDSDLDLFVLISKEDIHASESIIRQDIQSIVQAEAYIDRGFVEDIGFLHQFLLQDGTIVDIGLITLENHECFNIQPTMKLVYDNAGAFASIIHAAEVFSTKYRSQQQLILEQQTSLFYMHMFTAIKSLKREDVWLTIFNLERARNVLFSLIRVSLDRYSPFLRRSEEKISDVMPESLARTVSQYRVTANLPQLRYVIGLLLEIFSQLKLSTSKPALSLAISNALQQHASHEIDRHED